VAAASVANGVARGAWASDAADAAAQRIGAAIADLLPDPDQLTPEEVYRIEREALASYSAAARRRATGPVLCWLADTLVFGDVPDEVQELYFSDPPLAALLLRAGRPEAARRAMASGSGSDTTLATDIAAALAERHLASGRAFEALHELATIPDPTDLILVDDDLIDHVAAAVVKDRSEVPVDKALADADVLLDELSYVESVQTMVVELLLQRTRARPGSAALDVSDLERAFAIDPSHPAVPRSLAIALTVRGMETAETRPAQAVADVDRATDIFMGDAEITEVASKVALLAASILWGRQRDRAAADHALSVALAIDPQNIEALRARMMLRGQR
jgi:hypothetical protein